MKTSKDKEFIQRIEQFRKDLVFLMKAGVTHGMEDAPERIRDTIGRFANDMYKMGYDHHV